MNNKKKILVPLLTRGNIAKLLPVVRELNLYSDEYVCEIVVGGALVSDFYNFKNVIIKAFPELENANFCKFQIGDGTKWGMADSFGSSCIALNQLFYEHKYSSILIVGDRYEALALATMAACNQVPIIHLEGGERSGCLDESIRHAITKLSSLHIVANKKASVVVEKLGELKRNILIAGATSMFFFQEKNLMPKDQIINLVNSIGIGSHIDISKPFLTVNIHPDNFDPLFNSEVVTKLLEFINIKGIQVVWLSPNNDAGAERINKVLRGIIASQNYKLTVRFIKALPVNYYASLLNSSSLLIGNSSSGIREASALGLRVINLGGRQLGRETGGNVTHAKLDDIVDTYNKLSTTQNLKEKLPINKAYGDFDAAKKAAEFIISHKSIVAKKDPIYTELI